MNERKLTEEAREIADGIMATVAVVTEDAEWLRGLLRRAAREALEAGLAQEQRKDEALRAISETPQKLGFMPYVSFVRETARNALAAVPVETWEAAAPDDYTRPGWRMFPIF